MAERMECIFRRGMISPKGLGKLAAKSSRKPKIMNETRVQNSRMADFDGKSKDEGANRDRGPRSVAGSRHIDTKLDLGTPAGAGGRPSRGGFQRDEEQLDTHQIGDANNQPLALRMGRKGKAAD